MLLACRLAGLSGLVSSQWRNLVFHPRARSLFSRPPGVRACHVVKICEVSDAVPFDRGQRGSGRSGPGQSRGPNRQDFGRRRQARLFHIR